MTPCEEKGYKVGDRFRVINSTAINYSIGDILCLYVDDGSTVPEFINETKNGLSHCNISNLEPLTPQWRGPEDGLPPIGSRVKLDFVKGACIAEEAQKRNGKEVEVIAHLDDGEDGALAVVWCPDDPLTKDCFGHWVEAFNEAAFEPLQSDRDRAVDAMLPAIREVALNFGFSTLVDNREFAERLYDLGICKTEES